MKSITLLILLGLSINTVSGQVNKHGPPCGGMNILDVGIHMKGHPVQQIIEIRAEQLKEGFTLDPTDSSYKVVSFVIYYDDSKNVIEVPIKGRKANLSNAKFLKTLKLGDQIQLECINIEKGKETSLSTSLWITITD